MSGRSWRTKDSVVDRTREAVPNMEHNQNNTNARTRNRNQNLTIMGVRVG